MAVIDKAGEILVQPISFGEDAAGYERLFALLGPREDMIVAMEATGQRKPTSAARSPNESPRSPSSIPWAPAASQKRIQGAPRPTVSMRSASLASRHRNGRPSAGGTPGPTSCGSSSATTAVSCRTSATACARSTAWFTSASRSSSVTCVRSTAVGPPPSSTSSPQRAPGASARGRSAHIRGQTPWPCLPRPDPTRLRGHRRAAHVQRRPRLGDLRPGAGPPGREAPRHHRGHRSHLRGPRPRGRRRSRAVP